MLFFLHKKQVEKSEKFFIFKTEYIDLFVSFFSVARSAFMKLFFIKAFSFLYRFCFFSGQYCYYWRFFGINKF